MIAMKYPLLQDDGSWEIIEVPRGVCPRCYIKSGTEHEMKEIHIEQDYDHPEFGVSYRNCKDCGHNQVAVIDWQGD